MHLAVLHQETGGCQSRLLRRWKCVLMYVHVYEKQSNTGKRYYSNKYVAKCWCFRESCPKKIKQKTKTKQKNTAGYLKYSISIGSRYSKQTGRIVSLSSIFRNCACWGWWVVRVEWLGLRRNIHVLNVH